MKNDIIKKYKEYKEERNHKRIKRCRAKIQKKKNRLETYLYNVATLTLTPKNSIDSYFVESFFQKCRKKRKFQRMEWARVPAVRGTHYCMMGECCPIRQNKIKHGYYNVLDEEFVCEHCWGNEFRWQYYNDNSCSPETKIGTVFPLMCETFADMVYALRN